MRILCAQVRKMHCLIRLGSRLHVVGEIVALVMLVKSCEQPAETSGTGGSTTTATDGGGGAGGDTGGMAGSGGETMTGGTGGATVTGGGGSGGSGGTTACVPSFVCGPKDCGMVDDGCGTMLDCDHSMPGDPITCASQNANQDMGGPMTCGAGHTCECPMEGSQEAADLCDGTVVQVPGVAEFCSVAGCDASLCGTPPVAKVPESCRYAGAKADETQVWCCTKPQT